MKRLLCVICKSKLNNIFLLNNIPFKSINTINPIRDSSNLSFAQCKNCNTIQLDELIPLNILYSESHNLVSVGKTWEKYFKLFCNNIEPIITNKTVLEVGCPSGKIALNLNNYNHWIIVEPNINKNVKFNEKIIFIQDFFDEHFKIDKTVDVIVHSHLFEHIYEPSIFLNKCFEILSENGEMFFGIPNMEHIAEAGICPFVGVGFEHTIFLNKENINYLLNSHGFKIISIIDYEKHSTLYHCQKIKSPIIHTNIKIKNYDEIFNSTINEYKLFVINCNNIINNANTEVYLFSSSYNSQLLLCLGLNENNITGILDNCKEKQGKYLYGHNLKIYDPNILTNKNCIVILKNGYYMNEVLQQLITINKNTHIIS